MSEKASVLSIHNLHYLYPRQTTGLYGITCTIPKGERTVVLGPNGAGKSTLLLALSGIYRPQQGYILVEGQPIDYSRQGLTRLRSQVGLVMQQPDVQLFCPVVYQDVAYGPTNLGLRADEVRERVEWALQVVGASSHIHRPIHCLSHGEKQRVAIAGVLAMRPRVILLDEPTAGLDRAGVADLLEELERLRENGTTLVMTTHDLDLAWCWADHFIVLDKGKKTWEGDYAELASRLELFEELGLGIPTVGLIYQALLQQGLLTRLKYLPRDLPELIRFLKVDCAGLDKAARTQ
ncbi:MAG: energy-coupling factor ABC transporter ATP-binding protein [Firmicutes bacterium]|nr:energy-coupling factor ABC transporter ATP-binding protein [Bacillota bacterium]